jgi:KUP system potassium uptake protein
VVITWFAVIGGLGLFGIVQTPSLLAVIHPWRAIVFVMDHGWSTVFTLGAVVLVVTGAEAK